MKAVNVVLLQRRKETTPSGLYYPVHRAAVVEEHTQKKKLWEIFRVINETEDFSVANKVRQTTWYKNCGCHNFQWPSHTSALKWCNEVHRALKVTLHLKVVEALFTGFLIRMLVFNWCIAQPTYVPCLSRKTVPNIKYLKMFFWRFWECSCWLMNKCCVLFHLQNLLSSNSINLWGQTNSNSYSCILVWKMNKSMC